MSRIRSRKRAKEEICRLLTKGAADHHARHDQPLNLCVRDVHVFGASAQEQLEQEQVVTQVQSSADINVHPRRRKKRSAIFVPADKLANEVCICKFKFVAGHEPRLQEKKVLSIDSGGNLRFFPEMNARNAPGNDAGVGGNTHSGNAAPVMPEACPAGIASRRMPDLIPIDTIIPVIPVMANRVDSGGAIVETAAGGSGSGSVAPQQNNIRPKLSRRQKLEQTFRDKGFLIQTQHVQATEGSVFCKFRQLKKFTRYLYRSWRDYLPTDRPHCD
nr:EOG090X02D0 [Leptodora kindtii]